MVLECRLITDETYAHHAIGKRDHPEPALINEMDRDIATHITVATRNIPEMTENGSRRIVPVCCSAPQGTAEETLAPGGIKNKTRLQSPFRSRIILYFYSGALAGVEIDRENARLFMGLGAMSGCVTKQEFIELRTDDLIGVVVPGTNRISERKGTRRSSRSDTNSAPGL